MTTTPLIQRAATPARVWVPAVALPGGAALLSLWLSRVATTEEVRGTCFAIALTALVIACTLGAIVCGAWRTRDLERRYQDDVSDMLFRLRRAERDIAALSELHEAQAFKEMAVGWRRPEPASRLYVVRDDTDPRRN